MSLWRVTACSMRLGAAALQCLEQCTCSTSAVSGSPPPPLLHHCSSSLVLPLQIEVSTTFWDTLCSSCPAKIFSGLHWEALDNVFYTKPPITESFVDRLPTFRWRERDHVQTFV